VLHYYLYLESDGILVQTERMIIIK
jgi:hypothetical protein